MTEGKERSKQKYAILWIYLEILSSLVSPYLLFLLLLLVDRGIGGGAGSTGTTTSSSSSSYTSLVTVMFSGTKLSGASGFAMFPS